MRISDIMGISNKFSALQFSCQHCDNICSSEHELNKHKILCTEKQVESDPDAKNFTKCDNCSKKMRNDNLKRHKLICKFSCLQCNKFFKSEPMLKIHIESHTKTQFPCEQCDKILFSTKSLKVHESRDHGEPTSCYHCQKSFKRKN